MTLAAVRADRLDAAVKLLLQGKSPHTVVTLVADQYGCSPRTARRVVAKAYSEITAAVDDVGLDRRSMVAQTVHCLQTAMAAALASNQLGVVVGVSRELRELLSLGQQHRHL